MDRRNNPYAPGAGLQPPELAGRDRLIEEVTIDMDRVLERRPTKGLVLLGLRGAGKTVLLNRLRAFADDRGFETTKIEAPEGGALPDLLAPELRRILYALDLRQAGGRHLRRAVNVLRGFANGFKIKMHNLIPASIWILLRARLERVYFHSSKALRTISFYPCYPIRLFWVIPSREGDLANLFHRETAIDRHEQRGYRRSAGRE